MSKSSILLRLRQLAEDRSYKGIWGLVRFAAWMIFCYYLNVFVMYLVPYPGMRAWLSRLRGVRIGKGVFIDANVLIDIPYGHLIHIENGVVVASGVSIYAHTKGSQYHIEHNLLPTKIAPVYVQQNAFIGAGTVVLPGVTIGEASVITSNSVVDKDIPDFTVAGGNPARPLMSLRSKNPISSLKT